LTRLVHCARRGLRQEQHALLVAMAGRAAEIAGGANGNAVARKPGARRGLGVPQVHPGGSYIICIAW
jgi:hypothetical protein